MTLRDGDCTKEPPLVSDAWIDEEPIMKMPTKNKEIK
jgi:hypothetical protein